MRRRFWDWKIKKSPNQINCKGRDYIKSLLDKKNEPAVKKPVLENQTLYETLESRMKSRMGTKVQIKRKSDDKGKIEIDYYSNDDLERIIELMGITKDTIE